MSKRLMVRILGYSLSSLCGIAFVVILVLLTNWWIPLVAAGMILLSYGIVNLFNFIERNWDI